MNLRLIAWFIKKPFVVLERLCLLYDVHDSNHREIMSIVQCT